jgi:site-specific DNA-methyltransferase (adenine-specific)
MLQRHLLASDRARLPVCPSARLPVPRAFLALRGGIRDDFDGRWGMQIIVSNWAWADFNCSAHLTEESLTATKRKSGKMVFPNDFLERMICGDAVEVLKKIPAESIDLAITSPPYNLKNSTGNGLKDGRGGKWSKAALLKGYATHDDNMPHADYAKWQREVITEVMRVLKPDGAFFYNHKWRVQAGRIQDRHDIVGGFPVRQIVIWQRAGGINFNPGYFLPTYEVLYMITKPNFKLKPKANAFGDIWSFPQEMNNAHPAPFPVCLIDRILRSAAGQIVLDPFMGSGTTALATVKAQRQFIGIDISQEYCDLAAARIKSFLATGKDPYQAHKKEKKIRTRERREIESLPLFRDIVKSHS